MRVATRVEVSIGHRLLGYQGLCANLHGHNYIFEIEVEDEVDSIGIAVDFKNLRNDMRKILDKFDHAMVLVETDPDIPTLSGRTKLVKLSVNPSAENFAAYVFTQLSRLSYRVVECRVWETSTSFARALTVNNSITARFA